MNSLFPITSRSNTFFLFSSKKIRVSLMQKGVNDGNSLKRKQDPSITFLLEVELALLRSIPTLFCSLQTHWIYNSTFTKKSTLLKGKKTPIHTFSRHPSITISLDYDIVLRSTPSINKRNVSPGVEKAVQMRSVHHCNCQDQAKQLHCWRGMKVYFSPRCRRTVFTKQNRWKRRERKQVLFSPPLTPTLFQPMFTNIIAGKVLAVRMLGCAGTVL